MRVSKVTIGAESRLAHVIQEFKAGEAAGAGLHRIVQELTASAIARAAKVPGAGHREEDVHELRLAIKWLRAILHLVRPTCSKVFYRRENQRLRAAARCLSPLRDADVARRTLERLMRKCDRKEVEQALRRARVRFHQDDGTIFMTAADHRAMMNEVAAALEDHERAFARLTLHGTGWQLLQPGLKICYEDNRRWMKKARRSDDGEDFHEWRKQAKALFYQLQMLRQAWPRRIKELLGDLKRLQADLGDDHDLMVVKAILCTHPARFGGMHDVNLILKCLEGRSHKLRVRASKRGTEFFSSKPGRFSREIGRRWKHLERGSV